MSLPLGTGIESVRLRVADLRRTLRFYHDILGFVETSRPEHHRGLSARIDSPPLLILEESRDASRPPRPTAGLYHAAIRFPSRGALGAAVRRVIRAEHPLHGAADHLVSEAVYMTDPEGNGIELYVDRPREEWRWDGEQIAMATDPLDLQSLLDEPDAIALERESISDGTDIGHIHLQVSDLRQSEEFYSGILGFEVMQRSYPGALFLSAGRYHHHIGLNIWGGRGILPLPTGALGLVSFRVRIPGGEEWRALCERSDTLRVRQPAERAAGDPPILSLTDPNGIAIELLAAPR
ncbi:MAG: VOC family protein [Bacteroidota bacterium]